MPPVKSKATQTTSRKRRESLGAPARGRGQPKRCRQSTTSPPRRAPAESLVGSLPKAPPPPSVEVHPSSLTLSPPTPNTSTPGSGASTDMHAASAEINTKSPRESLNLPSLKANIVVAEMKIQKEVALKRVAGPFVHPPFPNLQVSPLGFVPKKDGDMRLIRLSYPENMSINDFIDPGACSVHYSNIDQATEMIAKVGKGAYLAKTDIKSAFRLLPVSPGDFDLLGFRFQENTTLIKCYLLGLQLAAHYLTNIGVPIAHDKKVEPTQVLTFLGIELDTVNMTMKLSLEKLNQLHGIIQYFLKAKKASLREMQSLIGLLNFACKVVASGRAFCRRLINSTIGITKQHHRIRPWIHNNAIQLFTDSSGGPYGGFGIYFRGKWAYGPWPNSCAEQGITRDMAFLELFPVVVAITLWQSHFANSMLVFHIDNMSVVHIINNSTSKSDRVMNHVRKLVLIYLKSNVCIKALYIPTKQTFIADPLSRFQWGRFRRLAPQADL
ncbi:uncharacterized protein LOC133202483 [Saccostrea echinata]|uniref:uncharacterized protein LOC133202483 n=1 Tax=Saccostrea echinata TaxID=191078 RepID=UPI002A80BCFD|nr:uncharacterized protein LOC133202483 [Saccostrea echinata]